MKIKDADMKARMEKFRNFDPERVEEKYTTEDDTYYTRITKTLRMCQGHSKMMRDEAMRRTQEKGTRVSEADLLQEALELYRTTKGL